MYVSEIKRKFFRLLETSFTSCGWHWELSHYRSFHASRLLLEYHRPGLLPRWDCDYLDAIVLLYFKQQLFAYSGCGKGVKFLC